MSPHICERCGKEFARKTGITAHMKRKNPCKPPTTLVQKQVNEVLVKVAPHLEVPIAEFRDVSTKFHETLTKDQRQQEGIFFTPKKVREVLFEELKKLHVKPESILGHPLVQANSYLMRADSILMRLSQELKRIKLSLILLNSQIYSVKIL